ncbi:MULTISPECIES: DUF3024 domain-containing protein [Alcaligenaceae]|uniref:DUF3024 domain-containing protein n=1 Tax=Yanghanlia caeni TaxID=3064283 RepID=A0ABU1D9S8_9BURK|nr:DUF3024 domain-containing protein [Achromobacter sp. DMS1]KOF52000.1 hypothetical protein AD428_23110 [Achromobacter sp. DMS1]MDR4127198.1 DUF3024 domain-containing protein [Alcaligenaceae bacterium LG-2]HET8700935.1 DUF3024 domain-containing protein [Nitrococcus sp.]
MAFTELELARVHRTMTAYIAQRRPRPEIRAQLDIGYSVESQSVIIHEDRQLYDGSRLLEPVAKATWVRTQKVWKIFWMRADLRWHSYEPLARVRTLNQVLEGIDADPYGCFWG